MGVGGYLAAKAEQDTFRHRYSELSTRLSIACSSELEREVHDILGPLGLNENVSRVVARALVENEDRQGNANIGEEGPDLRKDGLMGRLGLRHKEVPKEGTAAFLLKLGEGMEEVSTWRLVGSALTIGLSYAIG